MSKFVSAMIAAIFALVTVTPVAFADKHEMKKGEEMEKKDEKKAEAKKDEKKAEAKKDEKKADEKKK